MVPSDSRRANRSAVLARLMRGLSTTRAQLAAATGLSPATVSRVIEQLVDEGLVAEGPEVLSGRRGRKASSLRVRAERGVTCGIDLGGTTCRFLIGDLLGHIVDVEQEPTPVDYGPAEIADWIVARTRRMCERVRSPLLAVAVGLPGVVALGGSRVTGAPNLRQIESAEFGRRLVRRMDAPVMIDNDSNLALLGEMRFGAAQHLATVVMFTIGTGLGSGVAIDGQLLRGRNGQVGEFGFVPAGPSGEILEDWLSGAGLVRSAEAGGTRFASAEAMFGDGDAVSYAPMRELFERGLLTAFAIAAVAYDPDVIVVGGGLTAAVEPRLAELERRLRALVPVAPRLVMSQLGDLAGALGALAAACQRAYIDLDVTEADVLKLPPATAIDGAPTLPRAPRRQETTLSGHQPVKAASAAPVEIAAHAFAADDGMSKP